MSRAREKKLKDLRGRGCSLGAAAMSDDDTYIATPKQSPGVMRGPGHSTSAAIIRQLAPAMRAPVSEHVQSHAAAGALSQAGLTSLGSEPCRAQADHQGFPIRGSRVTISAVSIWLCTDSTARSTAVRRQVLAAAIASRSRISGEPHTCTAALTMRL